MKKILYRLVFWLFFFFSSASAVTNKTFFIPRPICQDVVLQHAMTTYLINHKKAKGGFSISSKIFYEESTNSNGLAKYFFPNNKTELVVKGLGAGVEKDIAAEWLNIASADDPDEPYLADNDDYDFSSKIKISPQMKRFGTVIQLEKRFAEHFYLTLSCPVVQVETNLKLKEFDIRNERKPEDVDGEKLNTIHNAVEGLNNPLMKYGKMSPHWQRLAGLADVRLNLGAFGRLKRSHVFNAYATFIIPTGYRPRAEYVFEPLVGNGRHFGVGCGGILDLKLSKKINFINSIECLYLLRGTEKRSFDLASNGPWSRYLLATDNKTLDRPTPLINFLTKDLKVTPGASLNLLSSIHLAHKSFDFEFGCNLYFKSSESVKLKNVWNENVGIAWFAAGELDDFSASYDHVAPDYKKKQVSSNITNARGDEIPFVPIESNNLNLSSCSHPKSFSGKFYATVGLTEKWYENFVNVHAGGSYEVAVGNKALSQWGLWLGMSLQV